MLASHRDSLVIAVEKAVDELNRIQENVSFMTSWLDVYSQETDLLSSGE